MSPAAELDHLVLATPDLDHTVAEVTAATGVAPAEGGRHLGYGTRNFLYGLGPVSPILTGRRAPGSGAYLEIVGPDEEQPAPRGPRWFGIDALDGPRLVAWAARVDGIAERVAYARARGYDPGEPVSMARRASDGSSLAWRLTLPGPERLLPFLLDWGAAVHPSERGLPVLPLLSFEAGHPDPEAVRAGLDALCAGAAAPRVTSAPRPYLRAVVEGPRGRVGFGRGVVPS
ncbi:VOC family protein [Streptomyces luteolus]|uniref:VOC family protein n=1 Tax=Streptomyces luteolus TaxID=3043615 RepID=A0ABT6T1E7_9ACTN|nr:VOC family protein [Streptomyces sp. B-S-A12]MDI3421456.1 VOC family protein [Streptomyces sp. B-S-A12]